MKKDYVCELCQEKVKLNLYIDVTIYGAGFCGGRFQICRKCAKKLHNLFGKNREKTKDTLLGLMNGGEI